MNSREALRLGGFGAIAAGLYLWATGGGSSSSGSTPKPSPSPGPTPAPQPAPGHQAIATWIHNVRATRTDATASLARAAAAGRDWVTFARLYLQEQWPDYLSRVDVRPVVALGDWVEVEGSWISEQAAGFFNRADIHAAWFGYPGPPVLGTNPANGVTIYGSTPGKVNVVGEFLKEQGLPDPQYGWAGAPL